MRHLYTGVIFAAVLTLSTLGATGLLASNGPVWP